PDHQPQAHLRRPGRHSRRLRGREAPHHRRGRRLFQGRPSARRLRPQRRDPQDPPPLTADPTPQRRAPGVAAPGALFGPSYRERKHDLMNPIVTVQDAVTAFADFMEPTDAELDAIEREMPVILADDDLIDAYLTTLDRTPTELDNRRIRRARRRALAARLALLNRTDGASVPGGAA